MNIKNPKYVWQGSKSSKFLKRIQALRHLSVSKLQKKKVNQTNLAYALENAIRERDGIQPSYISGSGDKSSLKRRYNYSDEDIDDGAEVSSYESDNINTTSNAGMITLDNVCFHLDCKPQQSVYPSDDENNPSIESKKGSICVTNSRYGVIAKVAKQLGFRLVKEIKLWNVLWTDTLPGVELYKNMKRFQQINHFPGMMEICRKDLLSRNLNRMLKLYPRDYRIFPKTWIFPADYGEALKYANNNTKSKARTFIIKPDAGAQGRGIWLTNDLKTISPTERMICQTYIPKPLLIDGYKFDLRVYTLITSVDPLRVFVYNEGLARFATSKYMEPRPDNSNDLFMHLTNYSVNKRSSQYDLCDNDDCGSKRTFSAINSWMQRRQYNVQEFWNKIDDIIIKTILSAWPVLKHNYHACFPSHDKIHACFEILGFDILVDSKLRPYILEVNHSPSFHTNEEVDRQVKRALIRDTLTLVGTVLADKWQILREDRKRVKQRLLQINTMKRNSPSFGSKANKIFEQKHSLRQTVKETESECPLSALAQQVAWEESHLGDFRRIMPPHEQERLNYYCQFSATQNQASIYADTAASKKREDLAKKLRLQLEERHNKRKEILPSRLKFEERQKKRASLSRAVLEKHRLSRFKANAHWSPGFISDAEERLRRTWMHMRAEILRSMNVLPILYQSLYDSGNLSNADIITYPDLYRSCERGKELVTEI